MVDVWVVKYVYMLERNGYRCGMASKVMSRR